MEWISVKDRIPKDTARKDKYGNTYQKSFLVFCDNEKIDVAYLNEYDDGDYLWSLGSDHYGGHAETVTHWMDLPSNPKDK